MTKLPTLTLVPALVLALLLTVPAALGAQAAEIGFSRLTIPGPNNTPMDIGVWYPTDAPATDQQVGLFEQHVAPDAPIIGTGHGLVVISHGDGGSLDNHYDTAIALAGAGFVAVAITHPGDNWRDRSRATDLADRPRAVKATIDYMLAGWPSHAALDPAKIGIFGFSAGGITALVAAGAIPDLSTVGPYCRANPANYVCAVVRDHPLTHPIAESDWVADPRIKAAVVAAPPLPLAFTKQALAAVHIPIQLWQAGDDQILAPREGEPTVAANLPTPPELHIVPGADHFDFIAPCSDALDFLAPAVCQERNGFDRAAFHRNFNAAVTQFFQRELK